TEEELQNAWAEMEKLQAEGKALSIGVSNFLQKDLEVILKTAKVVPAVNQIEYHPHLQHGDLVPFMKKHGIQTAAYGPLTPVTRVKEETSLKALLSQLAEKYSVSSAEVLLRWSIEQGSIPITTSGKESRMRDYTRAASFTLTAGEVQKISEEGAKKHYRAFWTDKFAADDRS
ncbi:hypothetical protein KEM54_002412, partial [Ascosphaera aggregata]